MYLAHEAATRGTDKAEDRSCLFNNAHDNAVGVPVLDVLWHSSENSMCKGKKRLRETKDMYEMLCLNAGFEKDKEPSKGVLFVQTVPPQNSKLFLS